MDIVKAINIWLELGNDFKIIETSKGYYNIFLEKGQNVGFIKASGIGFQWSYPDSLMKVHHLYNRGGVLL